MKAIVFLHYRAGSTFFQHLSGHTPKFIRKELGLEPDFDTSGHYKMTTKGHRVTSRHVDCGSINKAAGQLNPNTYNCLLTHIGNWWGDLPPHQIPAPLHSLSPMKWSAIELKPFMYQDWKFVNLIRDGRNMTESLRRLRGGVEEQQQKIKGAQYFEELCLAWRNKARVALNAQTVLGKDRYKIFKFEDMMDQPLQFMNDIYQFAFGLSAEDDIIRERLGQIRKSYGSSHSSFGSTKEVNDRHLGWTEEEKQLFEEIAGPEQKELGYEC